MLTSDGDDVGAAVDTVGMKVGTSVGAAVEVEGDAVVVGNGDGSDVGCSDGLELAVGKPDGSDVGCSGLELAGPAVGSGEGAKVGAFDTHRMQPSGVCTTVVGVSVAKAAAVLHKPRRKKPSAEQEIVS